MALEYVRLYSQDPWVQDLYEKSFPENERKNLKFLMRPGQDTGKIVLALRDGEKVGFYCILRCLGICHIIYFAVPYELRGHGIGGEILHDICNSYPNERIIVDIELIEDGCPNSEQRLARKQFYLHNGFSETDISYRWEEEDYQILSYGGKVSYEEWDAFWDYIDQHDANLLY